jgi:pSer/pThr/pTyr-binding forkhead associated (FHA) protein
MVGPPVALMLEIVEGPGAGTQFDVSRPLVIGRDDTADLVIEDSQASRRHARIEPTAHGAIVEDLQSTNGTFINDNELHGRSELGPDDELLIGVTVMVVRTPQQVERQPSAVRAVPAFAAPESRPTFTEPVRGGSAPPTDSGVPELERLRDSRVKTKASLAPLTIFVLAALAVVIYLGVT